MTRIAELLARRDPVVNVLDPEQKAYIRGERAANPESDTQDTQ